MNLRWRGTNGTLPPVVVVVVAVLVMTGREKTHSIEILKSILSY